jgi:hypothetical protein
MSVPQNDRDVHWAWPLVTWTRDGEKLVMEAYRVANYGCRVESRWKRVGVRAILGDEWRPLKIHFDRQGYATVHLFHNKVHYARKVATLVLENFVRPRRPGEVG